MQANSQSTDNMNRAATSAAKVVSDGASKLSEPVSEMGARLLRVKDQIVTAVTDEAGVASKFTQEALDQVPVFARYVERSIRRHPFAAAGIAIGIGAVAVKLATSRKTVKTAH